MNENVLAKDCSTGSSLGASTNTPQRPYTTEGTAASRSIRIVSGPRSRRGHSSVTNSEPASAIGRPMISARIEVTRVPNSSGKP